MGEYIFEVSTYITLLSSLNTDATFN